LLGKEIKSKPFDSRRSSGEINRNANIIWFCLRRSVIQRLNYYQGNAKATGGKSRENRPTALSAGCLGLQTLDLEWSQISLPGWMLDNVTPGQSLASRALAQKALWQDLCRWSLEIKQSKETVLKLRPLSGKAAP